MRSLPVVLSVVAFLASAVPVNASALKDRLERDLVGAWIVLGTEVYSNCNGTYSDNEVFSAGVSSKADLRFDPGELARVDKVKVKRSRVDLLLSLEEPILRRKQEGPFELFEEASCRIQLIFDVPRDWIKQADHRQILTTIDQSLTTFRSLGTAQDAPGWNRRVRDPLPEDYSDTLVRFEIWKAERDNLAIQTTSDQALDTAAAIAAGVRSDPAYLEGFADGTRELRYWSERDCDRLMSVSFDSVAERPGQDRDKAYKQGFRDGQELVFSLTLAQRLKGCYVPIPPMPE